MANKKILVLMHYLELGGAESALLGLLQAHDPSRCEMHVFIYDHRGELMPYIPLDRVNLLPPIPEYTVLERPIVELIKRGFLGIAMSRLIARWRAKKYSKRNIKHLDNLAPFAYQQKATLRCLPQINPDCIYDLAISFHFPHFIVSDKVNAKKRLGWIHTDYTNVFVNPALEDEMWSPLDYIASISSDVGMQFVKVFPYLESKLLPIENIISPTFILSRATEFIPVEINHNPNVVNLLSIGRFCHQKRFDEIGTIARHLNFYMHGKRLSFQWYIIGYGNVEDTLKITQNIKDEGMSEFVHIIGKQENPYPYLKACDIYVQPSRYEGKSITVREAQILGKPVVVSAYPTASSQIDNGVDGVILPMESISFAFALAQFICDQENRQRISANLIGRDYGNESEIEKIYKIINV